MLRTAHRRKLSTTISVESYNYLKAQVESGQAASIAEAVDGTVAQVRTLESHARLEHDTAAYFQNLSPQAIADEAQLGAALGAVVDEVDLVS